MAGAKFLGGAVYLENRLIAMLDVLGFAERIQTREGLERTTAQYAQLIARAKGHMFSPKAVPGSPNDPEPNFEYGQFVFDTLVLVSYPLDIKSACRFVFATILLMELFFAEKFPLRGSIGIGDFSADEDAQIFLSNAFKRLRLDEERQQWTGCAILPEAEEIVVSSLLGNIAPDQLPKSAPLHRCTVPMKSQDSQSVRWCVNWSHFLSPGVIGAGLKYMAGDAPKQANTSQYLTDLAKLSDDTQTLPLEFVPAKRLKFMKARSSMRVKFEDDNGNGVNPGCSYTIAAYEGNA